VTGRGLIDAIRPALAVCHLHGAIAVGFGGLDLRYAIVRYVDYGHRYGVAVIGENAGHADFAANQS
jgi:hypothetical protein